MRSQYPGFMMLALPLLVAAALVTNGCTPQSARWSEAESPKSNKVDFVTNAHKVEFVRGAATASTAQTKSLSDFIHDAGLSYGDRVTIDGGPSRGNAAADRLAARRVAAVTAMLRHMNVRATVAARPTIDGALTRDGVIVTVGHYVVTPPACPDRSKVDTNDFANTEASNYGCATITNLGLMVANPADLLHGEPAGAADGTFAARGVEEYRSGALMKPLQSQLGSAGGGN
jgi:pilus assembly protein CpaD